MLKNIFALPTWGQESLVSELQPFGKGTFDLGHPVAKHQIFYHLLTNQNVKFEKKAKNYQIF